MGSVELEEFMGLVSSQAEGKSCKIEQNHARATSLDSPEQLLLQQGIFGPKLRNAMAAGMRNLTQALKGNNTPAILA